MSEIIYNLPMADYLAHPGIGSSSLKKILETPADFLAAQSLPADTTPALDFGTAVHTAILEPDMFDSLYAVQKEDWGPLNTGEGKKKWDELKKLAKCKGKTPLKFADYQRIAMVIDNAASHAPLQDLLACGRPEVTCFAEEDDIEIKARVDWLTHESKGGFDAGWVWDLKTTSKDIDDASLSWTIFKYGYHFQAAHHTNVLKACGVDVKGWGWIFVSTGTPCPHIVMRKASPRLLAAGQQDWSYAMEVYKDCVNKDSWWGLGDEPTEISLPEKIEGLYE